MTLSNMMQSVEWTPPCYVQKVGLFTCLPMILVQFTHLLYVRMHDTQGGTVECTVCGVLGPITDVLRKPAHSAVQNAATN